MDRDGLFPLKGATKSGHRAEQGHCQRWGDTGRPFPVRDPGCKECGSSAEPPEERRPVPAFPRSLEVACETHRQRQQPPYTD